MRDMIPAAFPGFAAKAAVGIQVLRTHHTKDGELDATFDIVANLWRELMATAGRKD